VCIPVGQNPSYTLQTNIQETLLALLENTEPNYGKEKFNGSTENQLWKIEIFHFNLPLEFQFVAYITCCHSTISSVITRTA